MKRELKLSLICKFILFSLLLVIILYKNNSKENAYQIMEQTDLYDLKIDYLLTGIKELDKENIYVINKEKEEFLKIVESSKEYIEKSAKYNFILEAQTQEYKERYFTHIVSNKYVGGAHYERSDYTFVFDKERKKFLKINDFIKEDKINEFLILVKHLLYRYGEKENIILDNEWVLEGTSFEEENYQNFYLDEQGMTVIFVPYQVSSWSDGEIKIFIPWKELNALLKEEYINEDCRV